MEIKLTQQPAASFPSSLLAVFQDEKTPLAGLTADEKIHVEKTFAAYKFSGKPDQMFSVRLPSQKTLLVVGLGPRDKFHVNALRNAFSTSLRMANNMQQDTVSAPVVGYGLSDDEVAAALAETAIMTSYKFDAHKSEKQEFSVKTVQLCTPNPDALSRELELGIVFGEQNIKARELVNTPPAMATPSFMAQQAQAIARVHGLQCTVYGRKELEAKGMNAILAVGSGSANEPKLVVLEYDGTSRTSSHSTVHSKLSTVNSSPVCLVGKGVCFDAGGLNVKSASGMETMKEDKAGAVAVMMAVEAAARLKLQLHVVGIMPFVENLLGDAAFKPGDIIKTASGKTIEVLNTDAEGRIILADALHLASSFKPQAIVDVATLTGACVTALGNFVSGLMTNDEKLAASLVEAGNSTYERVWQLPMFEEYAELVKSEHADVKNVTSNGPNPAGAISAAKFLELFVD
ncbi:leucyl aminopeptidase, partial [Candidatus Woesearchaeota archaeon]|nr:leucyl aminopeptidase [Candidatus Woesearchaeota archaeon]